MASITRLTFSLSSQTAEDLTHISQKLGVSRSGLVDGVLSAACADMVKVVDLLPESAQEASEDPQDLTRRLRGASVEVVNNRIQSLTEILK